MLYDVNSVVILFYCLFFIFYFIYLIYCFVVCILLFVVCGFSGLHTVFLLILDLVF